MWVPARKQTRWCCTRQTRKSMALFGAVNLKGGQMISPNDLFDAESFLAFLKSLLQRRSRGKKMVVITDNARYHHAAALKD